VWLRFLLAGVEETVNQAGQTAKAMMKLAAADGQRIQAIGKASGSALRVHRRLTGVTWRARVLSRE